MRVHGEKYCNLNEKRVNFKITGALSIHLFLHANDMQCSQWLTPCMILKAGHAHWVGGCAMCAKLLP